MCLFQIVPQVFDCDMYIYGHGRENLKLCLQDIFSKVNRHKPVCSITSST